jgi:glucokinase
MKKFAAAIDLGGTNIKAALVDQDGFSYAPYFAPTGDDHSPEAVIGRLVEVVESLRASAAEQEESKIIGVGLGCPGGVYPDRAVVSQSPNFPGWHDVNLRAPLEERLALPVLLENDANVAALAEYRLGIGRGVNSMILMTLGTGIGGGVILNGRIWQGTWGMAGEIGHITVEPEGPPCGCGSHGCLEALASGPALVRQAREGISRGEGHTLIRLVGGDIDAITPQKIYQAALLDEELSLKVLTQAAKYLGIVIASVLNLLNIPLFAIGGGIGAAFDFLGPRIRDEVRRRAYRVPAENVRIERAMLGNDAGTLGAGLLVFEEFDRSSGRNEK